MAPLRAHSPGNDVPSPSRQSYSDLSLQLSECDVGDIAHDQNDINTEVEHQEKPKMLIADKY